MLLGSSKTRGAPAQTTSRPQSSSNGRGTTGRGGSHSSSKLTPGSLKQVRPEVLKDSSNTQSQSRYPSKKKSNPNCVTKKKKKRSSKHAGTNTDLPKDPREERFEHALKREKAKAALLKKQSIQLARAQHYDSRWKTTEAARAVRLAREITREAREAREAAMNGPFASALATQSPFGAPSTSGFNPFAQGAKPDGPPARNPFGAPSQPSTCPFGNQFTTTNGSQTSAQSTTKPFGAPSAAVFSKSGAPSSHKTPSGIINQSTPPRRYGFTPSMKLKSNIETLLSRDGIKKPDWPTSDLGNPKNYALAEAYWRKYKEYRTQVRASLIRENLLDDPDKPKRLSEAIDFKGICSEMCPEFEKITRIVEHDVVGPERECDPHGNIWPHPAKMIKALARSAAGQDAPLPMDVRSPDALRCTLDYLLQDILQDDKNLPSVHGFLWNRTRAIRRDFVFQSSMNPDELNDQVYCLERITRFHVIALHQMSNPLNTNDDFSEQQEVEQLGKSLLSLIHAYDDCSTKGVTCENEPEFRAYYVLLNGHNSGVLEAVQNWGWKFWGESHDIKMAVSLVETLQSTWSDRGPLKPHSATDVSPNAFSRYFSTVENTEVSYTMACFAEIHFNTIRKAILTTILSSYRKQRDQTKDWTLTKLNTYLRFDHEKDVYHFGEAYGLQFYDVDGVEYMSFESGDAMSDPFPPRRQLFSSTLVERKRGGYSLPAVIDSTVYEYEPSEMDTDRDDERSMDEVMQEGEADLFVKDNNPSVAWEPKPGMESDTDANERAPTPMELMQEQEAISMPTTFAPSGDLGAPNQFGADLFAPKPNPTTIPEWITASSSQAPIPSQFTFPPVSAPMPSSSFAPQLPQPAPQPLGENLTTPFSFGVSAAPAPDSSSNPVPQFSLGNYAVTGPGTEPQPQFSLGNYAVSGPSVEAQPQFSMGNYAVSGPSVEAQPQFSLGNYAAVSGPGVEAQPQFSLGNYAVSGPSMEPVPQFSLGNYAVSSPSVEPRPQLSHGNYAVSSPSVEPQPQLSLGNYAVSSPSVQPTPQLSLGNYAVSSPSVQPTPQLSLGNYAVSSPSVQPTPQLSLGSYAVSGPSVEPKPQFSLENHTVSNPGAEPKSQFSLGNYTVTSSSAVPDIVLTPPSQEPLAHVAKSNDERTTLPKEALGQPLPKETVELPLQQPLFAPPPTTTGGASHANPEQLHTSHPNSTERPTQNNETVPPPHKPSTSTLAPMDKETKFSNFCNWVAIGEHGIMDQFTEATVENILKSAVDIFVREERERIQREVDELARQEADQFRRHSLSVKYARKWREAAHLKWLRRKGRNARRARQEMAESLRASRAAQPKGITKAVKAPTKKRRRSLESLLNATGVLDGVHNSTEQIRTILKDDTSRIDQRLDRSTNSPGAGIRTDSNRSGQRLDRSNSSPGSGIRTDPNRSGQRLDRSTNSPGSGIRTDPNRSARKLDRSTSSPSSGISKHKRVKSDNPLRRSLLSDPSYLTGGSRTHLLPKYSPEEHGRRQVSGVQTDYFRLKARGIVTLPDGSPLASSVAYSKFYPRRSLDESTRPETPTSPEQLATPSSVPAKSKYLHHESQRSTVDHDEDIQELRAKSKALMDAEKARVLRQREQKRAYDDTSDEELFARAKRVREQMDEGAEWFRKEIEKSRSSSRIS